MMRVVRVENKASCLLDARALFHLVRFLVELGFHIFLKAPMGGLGVGLSAVEP